MPKNKKKLKEKNIQKTENKNMKASERKEKEKQNEPVSSLAKFYRDKSS